MDTGLSVLMKKYAAPVIFALIGVGVIAVGISSKQSGMFMMAAVFLFVASILSFLYSSGKIQSKLINILGVIAGVTALFTVYLSVKSVLDSEERMEVYKLSRMKSEQNLNDIRFIQKRHVAEKGRYAKDWDEFYAYVNEATMIYVDARGSVPGRFIDADERAYLYGDNRAIDKNMTEEEAWRLSQWSEGPNYAKDFSNFVRDTTYVPLVKTKFGNASYLDARKKNGLGPFSLDSLQYVPFTGEREKWEIETRDSVMYSGSKIPTILVSGKLPFPELEEGSRKAISFGDLKSNDTQGSWEK